VALAGIDVEIEPMDLLDPVAIDAFRAIPDFRPTGLLTRMCTVRSCHQWPT